MNFGQIVSSVIFSFPDDYLNTANTIADLINFYLHWFIVKSSHKIVQILLTNGLNRNMKSTMKWLFSWFFIVKFNFSYPLKFQNLYAAQQKLRREENNDKIPAIQ